VGLFLSLLFFVIIELLHANGYFIGIISEYFISLQFRRGIWIATLFSLIIIVTNNRIIFKDISNKGLNFLAFIAIIVYIKPHPILTPFVFCLLFLLAYWESRNKVIGLLAGIPMLLIIISSYKYNLWLFEPTYNYLFYVLVACVTYYSFLRINIGYTWREKIIISISTYLILNLAYSNIVNRKFTNSAKILFNNKLFQKTNYHLLAKNIYKKLDLKMAEYLYNLPNDEKQGYYMIIPHNANSYSDPAPYGIPIYFNGYHELIPTYGRAQYINSNNKLINLYGKDAVDKFWDTYIINRGRSAYSNLIDNYFDSLYSKLDIKILEELYNNYKIRYYISQLPRNDLNEIMIYEGDDLYLYDISLIK